MKDKFKELTPEHVEYIKHVYYSEMKHIEKMDTLTIIKNKW